MKQTLRNNRKACSGFTLIEILVVMAIIGILLAIAVPTLMKSFNNSKENASAATLKNLSLACFNYSMDTGSFPYGASSTAAWQTLFPTYLDNPNNLFLTQSGGHVPFTGANVAALKPQNVCWTITVNGSAGCSTTDPTSLPLLLSDLGGNYPTFANGAATTVTPASTSMWGTDGVTVGRIDQSTTFVRPVGGATDVVLVPQSFTCSPTAKYQVQAP